MTCFLCKEAEKKHVKTDAFDNVFVSDYQYTLLVRQYKNMIMVERFLGALETGIFKRF